MGFNFPLPEDFKTYFLRDFPYSSDINAGVTDTDIVNAFNLTNVNWNPAFWSSQQNFNIAYFYLSAHFLCLNLRASSQGINGQYNWIQQSKSVQGVAEGFTIPERISGNPFFAQLTKTNYGAQYFQLVLPYLVAPISIAVGRTRP